MLHRLMWTADRLAYDYKHSFLNFETRNVETSYLVVIRTRPQKKDLRFTLKSDQELGRQMRGHLRLRQ